MTVENPLVTFGIICCQQREFILSVLEAAFNQTYRPLEIVISDDASSDGTFELAVDFAKRQNSSAQVVLHQNNRRLGIGNCDQMVKLSSGTFIVMAHGDDISHPGRVQELVEAWRKHNCSMVTSNAVVINKQGEEQGLYSDSAKRFDLSAGSIATSGYCRAMLGAVLSFEPDIFKKFAPLDPNLSAFVHDWILPYRAALLKGIEYLPAPLIKYRVHNQNWSGRFLNAQNDQEELWEGHLANGIIQRHYMLHDTVVAFKQGYISQEQATFLKNCLQKSILGVSQRFSLVRNKLLAKGKRARWSCPEI